jgi:CRP/FNR family transcriptional regulator, cyclic AMP receptor protein
LHRGEEDPTAQWAQEVGRLWLFAELPSIELMELARVAERREYVRPDVLEHTAHETGAVYGLSQGHARVLRSSQPGMTVTIAEMRPGDLWGMSFLARVEPKFTTIEFQSSYAVVYVFPEGAVQGVFDRHSGLAYRLVEYLFTCLEEARDRIEELATLTVDQRVAQYLADRASRHPRGLVMDTQVEMAHVVGASRETVNRAVRRLLESGMVRHAGTGRGLIVPDPSRLQRQ